MEHGGIGEGNLPPKLPDTTNLVLTNRINEYSEIRAMSESVIKENNIPPL